MATVKGLSVAIGADTKEFNKEIKKMDRSIKDTNRQVDNLEKSLDLEFDSGNFLRAQKLAKEAIEQTDEKAKALKERLKYLEETGGVDTAGYRKVQDELVKTETNAIKLKDRLEEINNLKLDNIVGKVKGVGDGLQKVGGTLTKGITAPIVGAATALTALAKKSADTADEIGDFSQKIGLNTKEFQEWKYVATLVMEDGEKINNAFIKTNAVLGDIATGTNIDKWNASLAKIGLNVDDLAGKSTNEGFNILRDAISGLSSDTEKLGVANEIFGDRLGAEVLPLLSAEISAIGKLKQEANELGIVTEEQIELSANFNDSLDKLKQATTSLGANLAATVLPIMTRIVEIITDKVVPAVNNIIDKWNALDESTQKIIVTVAGVAAAIGPVLMVVGKLTSGVGSLIGSLKGVGSALTFLSAHPIIAIIGVIIGLVMLLYSTNEEVRDSINSLMSSLGEAFMPILKTIGTALSSILQAIMPLINILANILVPIIDVIAMALVPIIDLLADVMIPVIERVGKVYTTVFGAIPGVIYKILEVMENVTNGVINFINKLIREVNKISKHLGFEIGELNNVEFAANVQAKLIGESDKTKAPQPSEEATPALITANEAITQVPSSTAITNNVVNDSSTKNITVNLTIQNYADELDYDDVISNINLRLAEQM